MSEAMICILNDLYKAVETGAKTKLNKTINSLQPFLESVDKNTTAALQSEDNPLKDSNLIILCCKFGQIDILGYILRNCKQFMDSLYNGKIANVLDPFDKDGEGHNAFYYAIRSNNVEIVQLLLTKWMQSFNESAVACCYYLMLRAYEDLKLRNVWLTEPMIIFVESKIIASRLNSHNNRPNSRNDLGLFIPRVKWLLSNIESLKTVKGESKFLVITECIAQNMNILKAAYGTLPWEELEFCVISYIIARSRQQENSILPLVAISKEMLLSQLCHFAQILKSLTMQDLVNYDPNGRREGAVLKIKRDWPDFIPLYEIYDKVRDMYSLEKLEKYLKSALSVNYGEKLGRLVMIRVLQVLSDYLQNTPDNCKLSEVTSRIVLSALPKNTRNIVIDLRNTGCHAPSVQKRVDLEIKMKSHKFFHDVRNELKLLFYVVSRMISNEKLRITVDLLEKISKSDNIEEVCELGKSLKHVEKFFYVEHFKLFDETRIRKLLSEMSISLPGSRGTQMIMEIKSYFPSDESDFDRLPVDLGPSALQCSDVFETFDRVLDVSDLPLIRGAAKVALKGLSPTSHIEKQSKVLDFVKETDRIIKLNSRFNNVKFDVEKINMFLFELSFASTTKVEDVFCFDVTRNVCDKPTAENSRLFMKKSERQRYLKSKISTLKKLIGNVKYEDFLKGNHELKLAVELLLLDVLTLSEDAICDLENNIWNGEDCTPFLIGNRLRNYLAHSSALLDILPTDPAIAILSNAIQLTSDEKMTFGLKIGQGFSDNLSEAKERLNEKLKIVDYQSKLFRALEKGEMEKSKAMIELGADVFGRSKSHETTLHFVARSKNIDLAKFILEQNVNPDSTDDQDQTALHVAAAHGNIALFEHLKANLGCVDLEQTDRKERACLHLAAQNGQVETVAFLIKLGADVTALDENFQTPLFLAIKNNNLAVVEMLLDYCADMDGCEIIRVTPLHLAAEYNRVDVLKLMLIKGVHADIYLNSDPFIAAAENGCVEAVEILIRAGANVNAYFDGNFTALHIAAGWGHTEVAAVLLQNGAEADPPKNPDKPIHFAAENGHVEIIELLIQHKADLHCENSRGFAASHLAAARNHDAVLLALYEADVDFDTGSKAAPFHFAATNGCLAATKMLVENGAEPEMIGVGVFQCTALYLAAERGHSEVGKLLLHSGAEPDARTWFDRSTPLHAAIQKRANSLAQTLFEYGANYEAKNAEGMTPLHIGANVGNIEGVALLIKHRCNVNVLDYNRKTPLHLAVAAGEYDTAELLIKSGADVNATCRSGLTPLHAAVENDHLYMVELLVRYRADINFGRPPPIKKAMDIKSKAIIEYLIGKGADVSNIDLLCGLVALRNDDYTKNSGTEKYSDVIAAVLKGDSDNLKQVLGRGGSVNETDSSGKTALHIAVDRDDVVQCVSILLLNGADISVVCHMGNTVLHTAVKKPTPTRIIKNILEFASEKNKTEFVNTPTLRKCNTALHIAAKNGNLVLLKVLLKHGAIYEAKNRKGATPKDLSPNVKVAWIFNLLSKMFDYAKIGNLRLVEQMKAINKECVSVVAGARNLDGQTILQVVENFKHKHIFIRVQKIINNAK